MNMLLLRTVASLGCIGVLSLIACAPSTHPSISRAEGHLQSARADAAVAANAPLQLAEAEEYLDRAKHAWRELDSEDEVEHSVYLAERKIQTARAAAGQKEAEAEMIALHQMRDSLRLEGRTRAALRADEEISLLESEVESLRQELRELQTERTTRGVEITLSDVLFELDRAELKPGAARKLSPLITFLRRNPDHRVRIEGHTDSLGTAGYNLQLSQERAEAVRSLLTQNGIPANRVESQGYGEQYPVATNSTPEGRLQNRRVQVILSTDPTLPAPRS